MQNHYPLHKKVTKIPKKSHSPRKPTKTGEKHVFVHSHETLL